MDVYQDRYLEHIENKMKRKQEKHIYSDEEHNTFTKIMLNRHSVRRFNDNKINEVDALELMQIAISVAPSSCNRKGIYYKEVTPEYAERVLVGGKNWVGKANRVFFLFGAKQCYKNPKEIAYMPYLDAGFVAQNIYLLCEVCGIGCCFINPNSREPIESDDYFCGAIAVGDYDV